MDRTCREMALVQLPSPSYAVNNPPTTPTLLLVGKLLGSSFDGDRQCRSLYLMQPQKKSYFFFLPTRAEGLPVIHYNETSSEAVQYI